MFGWTPPIRWVPPGHTPLREAVERLGRRLYGPDWTGEEQSAGKVRSPEEWAWLQSPAPVMSGGGSRLPPAREPLRLPDPEPVPDYRSAEYAAAYAADRAALERYGAAVATLMNLVWQRQVRVLEVDPWGASQPRSPKMLLNPAVQKALLTPGTKFRNDLLIQGLDAALAHIQPLGPSVAQASSARHQAAEHFKAMVREQTVSGGRLTRVEAFEALQRAVGGRLTKAAFGRIWEKHAPGTWKRPGRPKMTAVMAKSPGSKQENH